jgi:hypothetical protein
VKGLLTLMSSTGLSLVITMVNSPQFVENKPFSEVLMFLVTLLPLLKAMILESTMRSSTSHSISTLLILGIMSISRSTLTVLKFTPSLLNTIKNLLVRQIADGMHSMIDSTVLAL